MIKGRDYIFPNITAEMGRTGYNNKSWLDTWNSVLSRLA